MPSLPDSTERPSAVTAALCGAVLGAGAVGALLLLSDRDPGWMAVSAGAAAVGALAVAVPVLTGRAWAWVALFVAALIGVLTAPAVAVALTAPADLAAGAALALLWAAVIALLLRADVREFCAGPVAGHERLGG